eukprot:1036438-Alexandrium_andersonii.AAC.1
MLEVALQARNVQRGEAQAIAEGWARLKAMALSEPRLGRAQVGLDLLRQAFAETFELTYPAPKPKVWVVLPQTRALYLQVKDLLEAAGAEKAGAWGSVDWREVVEARP